MYVEKYCQLLGALLSNPPAPHLGRFLWTALEAKHIEYCARPYSPRSWPSFQFLVDCAIDWWLVFDSWIYLFIHSFIVLYSNIKCDVWLFGYVCSERLAVKNMPFPRDHLLLVPSHEPKCYTVAWWDLVCKLFDCPVNVCIVHLLAVRLILHSI